MTGSPVRVGIAGLGFMGRVHLAAFRAVRDAGVPVEVVAIADRNEHRRSGEAGEAGNLNTGACERLFEPDEVRAHAEIDDLLADDGVDLVSVCTHTDSHVAIASDALRAGKHVLVEKPVSLNPAEIARLRLESERAERLCMPAMCMRFWPAWRWLREAIRSGELGPPRSVRFERLGSPPAWAHDFYGDPARSGGALVDLHIHDTDFVCFCFGTPREVLSAGDGRHVSTRYRYEHGPAIVEAEGGWLRAPGFPFRMRFLAEFEGGVADFDFGRSPQLRVHPADGGDARTPVPDDAPSGYEGQARHIVEAITGGTALEATLRDAEAVARVLEAERAGIASGVAVRVEDAE